MMGYKVFNPDWTCRGFQYEVGKTYEMDGKPDCCNRGFHFCEDIVKCFDYYPFNPENKVAEVEALGDIDTDGEKSCANKIRIVREISWEEVLKMVNTGKGCTGFCNSGNYNSGNRNSGNYNSGNRNTGDCNTGDWNTGDWNTGDWNTGDWNTGDWNTGDWNTGNCNTGDCNTGDWNTGDWNTTSFSSGCFNTEEAKILMFNKPSDWTFYDWIQSYAKYLMNQIKHDVLEWIYLKDMTDEEKKEHPESETTGGYLKVLDESECGQIWWDGLNPEQKLIIKALPNFDKSIFEEITGIKIDE